jgi:putative nucleotidyltransferase with HDIG domain
VSALELASRFAGAVFSRRLYAPGSPSWTRALAGLTETVGGLLREASGKEVTVGLIHDQLAVSGRPVPRNAPKLDKFEELLSRRAVEIITIGPGCDAPDLEILVDYLVSGEVELAPGQANRWLQNRGAQHVKIQHLKLADREGVESFRDVYRRGEKLLSQEQARAARDGRVHPEQLAELTRVLMSLVLEGNAPVATLLALKDRSDFEAVHSINVSTLVGAQARSLGLPPEVTEPIMLAGLLHDIGKTRVPESVLQRRSPLPAGERQLLARHTLEGARILLDSPQVPAVAPVVAARHHTLPEPDSPGLLSVELVKLADHFDRIRTLIPFEDAMGMAGAAACLVAKLGGRFNRYLLSRFVRMLGLGTEGAQVRLTTSDLAEVVRVHPELGLHPVVRILRGTGAFRSGQVVKLAEMAADRSGPVAVFAVPPPFSDLSTEAVDDLG